MSTLFSILKPTKKGASSAPFFQPQEKLVVKPFEIKRKVNISLPKELEELYSNFENDVEFYDNYQWIFLSEQEISFI
tara:strand:+ start:297 stop:527 length:231 start_codon:yes stop_codon:yes gene_type:complete